MPRMKIGRSRSRYSPYITAAQGAYKIAKGAYNAYKTYQGWKVGNKKQTSPPGLTTQHDVVNQYRRKRMPKRKRGRWVKFIKQVTAVQMKNAGTKCVVMNNNIQKTWTGGDSQRFMAVHLFGYNGSADMAELGTNDIRQLHTRDGDITDAKAFIGSGVLDVTARNVGNSALEVDVYKIWHTDYDNGENRPTFSGDILAAENETNTVPGYTPLTINSRGATPFQFPKLGGLGLKVISKKKHLVSPGGLFTYQLRDAKNYISKDNFSGLAVETSTYVMPKKTQTLLFIIKAAVGGAAGDTNSLILGCTRTYTYKVLEQNQDEDGFIIA